MATKSKRKSIVVRYLIMVILSIATVFFSFQIFQEVKTNSDLKASIEESETILKELKKEKELLETQKKNLGNNEYLQRIARGKFMYTKDDGEQVFKLPTKDEE